MLLRHSLLYLIGRGLPSAINFASIAIYTRLLPPEPYGQYALVFAGSLLANSILFQWLRLGLLRFLPAYGERPATLLATLRVWYLAMAGLVTVVGLIASLLAPDAAWRRLVLIGVPLVCALSWLEINLSLAQSQLAPGRYGLLSLAKAVIALAFGTALVLLGFGAAGPLLALTFATLLPTAILMRRAWRGVGWARPAPGLTRELLGYGLPLTATFALGFVISNSDRFMVAWFLGVDAAGTYAAGYGLGWSSVLVLMTIVNLAGYPLVMRAVESVGPAGARLQLQQNGLLLLAVGLPVLFGAIILAPNLARVMLGAPFREDGALILPWIALAAFFGGAALFYTHLSFQLGRRVIGQLWVTLIAALVNLGLNLIWIPTYGILGAAWATLVSYALAFALGWWLGRRIFPLPGLPADALKPVGAALVMAVVLWPCRAWLGPLAFIAQVSLGLLVYSLALFLLDLSFSRGRLVRLLSRGVPST